MSDLRLKGRFLLALTLLCTTAHPGAAQTATPEKERKAQLLNAELFLAINGHHAAEVDALLARGADPNRPNWLGFTPLMWAAVYGHQEAAQLLLERGADPALKDNEGVTASAWAAKNKRDDVAQMLRDAKKH